jgi:hypothetical protein
MFPDLQEQPFSGPMLVIVVLSPVGSLCFVREPMGTDQLSCSSLLIPIQNQTFGKQIALLANSFVLLFFMAYSLTLKMEETSTSKSLVDFKQTTQHYLPEDRTLYYQ